MWMAILEKDTQRIEHLTKYFNVHEYFGLFACIITGRSWEAINQGIDKVKFDHAESAHIKSEASMYVKEISIVLNRVPREMLLLLKANDLIRGLETALRTRDSDSAFLHMTKCCVKLINSCERDHFRESASFGASHAVKILKFNLGSFLREYFYLFKIFFYEFYLGFLQWR